MNKVCACLAWLFWLAAPAVAQVQAGHADRPLPLVLLGISSDGSAALAHDLETDRFWYVIPATGQQKLISPIPHTGYFSSISPDGRFVCFKQFESSAGGWSSYPALYDASTGQVTPLAAPAARSGNPTMARDGAVAFTTDKRLVALDAQRRTVLDLSLGFFANHLAFSVDSEELAVTDDEGNLWEVALSGGAAVGPALRAKGAGCRPDYSPTGEYLSVQSASGDVRVVDRGRLKTTSLGRGSSPQGLANGALLYSIPTGDEAPGRNVRWVATRITADGLPHVDFELAGQVGSVAARDGRAVAVTEGGLVTGTVGPRGFGWSGQPVRIRASASDDRAVALYAAAGQASAGETTGQVRIPGMVPYVHQVLDRDSSAGFTGKDACGPTSALMALLYFGKLSPVSPAGWHLSNAYTYAGHTYDIPAVAQSNGWKDLGFTGAYGYYLKTPGGVSADRRDNLYAYIASHGVPSGWAEASVSDARARRELDQDYPLLWLVTSSKTSGHYILNIGYDASNQTYQFNDPYGDMNLSGWGTLRNGAGV